MFSDIDGFPIWIKTLLPDPAHEGGVDYLVFPQGSSESVILVAQTMPTPGQGATIQTVMPVIVAQAMPTPEQSGTAQAVTNFEITVNQAIPAPSQSSTIESKVPKHRDNGLWCYYPPIYAIRTKGKQSVPAPNQGGFIQAEKPIVYVKPIPPKKQSFVSGIQSMPAPGQCVIMKSHRAIKKRDDEEEKILMLLMGVA